MELDIRSRWSEYDEKMELDIRKRGEQRERERKD